MPTRKIVLLEGDRSAARDIAKVKQDTFALWGRDGDVDTLTIETAQWLGDAANLADAVPTDGPLSLVINGSEIEATINYSLPTYARIKLTSDDERVRILEIQLEDLDSYRRRDYC